MFQLHERLANDTVKVGSFMLCEVLLMNDANYPWMILVPRRESIAEIHQLNDQDQQQLMRESVFVAGKMQVHYQADKMNIAALGNVVPQLHVHHIARYTTDMAWPKPVWRFQAALAYDSAELEVILGDLRMLFAEMLGE